MLNRQKEQIAQWLVEAAHALASTRGKPLDAFTFATALTTLEQPRQAEHGDLATNMALRLAKPLGMAPAAIGQVIAESLRSLSESKNGRAHV